MAGQQPDQFQQALGEFLQFVTEEQAAAGPNDQPGMMPMSGPGMAQNALASANVTRFSAEPNYGLPAEEPSAARIVADAMTAGTWPYMAAGIKELTGYDEGKSFDELRRQEQREVQRAKENYRNWIAPLEYGAPLGFGLAVGRGAKTLHGAVMRSGLGGGAYGGVRGYVSPIEPDTLDVAERLPNAMSDALVSGATAAGGRAMAGRGAQAFSDYFARRQGTREARQWQDRLGAMEKMPENARPAHARPLRREHAISS